MSNSNAATVRNPHATASSSIPGHVVRREQLGQIDVVIDPDNKTMSIMNIPFNPTLSDRVQNLVQVLALNRWDRDRRRAFGAKMGSTELILPGEEVDLEVKVEVNAWRKDQTPTIERVDASTRGDVSLPEGADVAATNAALAQQDSNERPDA